MRRLKEPVEWVQIAQSLRRNQNRVTAVNFTVDRDKECFVTFKWCFKKAPG
jgi:hypothetical protein